MTGENDNGSVYDVPPDLGAIVRKRKEEFIDKLVERCPLAGRVSVTLQRMHNGCLATNRPDCYLRKSDAQHPQVEHYGSCARYLATRELLERDVPRPIVIGPDGAMIMEDHEDRDAVMPNCWSKAMQNFRRQTRRRTDPSTPYAWP